MGSEQTSFITHIAWGRMEVAVDGETLTFKDCKVWPGGGQGVGLTADGHAPSADNSAGRY